MKNERKEINTKNIKISLTDFYNFIIGNDWHYDIYCNRFLKRYWIMDTYSPYNLYMEFETTTFSELKGDKITREEMINELLPYVRREKINKILKR